MPDWVKLVTKAVQSDLGPTESVQAGVFVQAGGFASRAMGRELGGIVGTAVAQRAQTKREDAIGGTDSSPDEGIAATLPNPPQILALTNQRLLFLSRSALSGKPKRLVHSIPREQLTAVDVDEKKLAAGLILRFSDDSFVYYDAPKVGNDPRPFVEASSKPSSEASSA